MALAIVDDHLGQANVIGEARFSAPAISVRALIRARVALEIERARAALDAAWTPIVPDAAEVRLNGDRGVLGPAGLFLPRDGDGRLDLEAQMAAAEEGFVRGAYFILLDDRQVEGLDEMIDLSATTEATFLLLTPLKGG